MVRITGGKDGAEAEIPFFAVASTRQGGQIGSTVVQELVRMLFACGIATVSLPSCKNTLNFWSSMGFCAYAPTVRLSHKDSHLMTRI